MVCVEVTSPPERDAGKLPRVEGDRAAQPGQITVSERVKKAALIQGGKITICYYRTDGNVDAVELQGREVAHSVAPGRLGVVSEAAPQAMLRLPNVDAGVLQRAEGVTTLSH